MDVVFDFMYLLSFWTTTSWNQKFSCLAVLSWFSIFIFFLFFFSVIWFLFISVNMDAKKKGKRRKERREEKIGFFFSQQNITFSNNLYFFFLLKWIAVIWSHQHHHNRHRFFFFLFLLIFILLNLRLGTTVFSEWGKKWEQLFFFIFFCWLLSKGEKKEKRGKGGWGNDGKVRRLLFRGGQKRIKKKREFAFYL